MCEKLSIYLESDQSELFSRTDKGVHGLNSSAVVDLIHPNYQEENPVYYKPKTLTLALNKRFYNLGLDIKLVQIL